MGEGLPREPRNRKWAQSRVRGEIESAGSSSQKTSSSSGDTRRMKPPPELPASCVESRPLHGRQLVAGGYICRAVCVLCRSWSGTAPQCLRDTWGVRFEWALRAESQELWDGCGLINYFYRFFPTRDEHQVTANC